MLEMHRKNAMFTICVEGNKTLYKMLNMESVDVEKYDQLYHHHSEKFISGGVDARQITRRLVSWNVLQ